ncbi:hypothetical protein B7760_02013 [Burkholderia glumae]|uniref:hypothetical protein n=1 Tax=Burkholderia glumae TaxID=337 RepID=UPI00157AB4CD|nr:hypothetical protein [Burkholderia glumae]MCR1769069.1 hypothetical protein [Burkholderia glumae]QKM47979.1 hypothetical protein B7760_02013 [Burkholderia glumae]
MPILIDYTTPGTGAVAGYHVVQQVTFDYQNSRSVAQLASYVSKQTYADGRQPLFSQPIEFGAMPPDGMSPRSYAEQKIVAPVSDKTSPTAARANFIGGSIVDGSVERAADFPPAQATDTSQS